MTHVGRAFNNRTLVTFRRERDALQSEEGLLARRRWAAFWRGRSDSEIVTLPQYDPAAHEVITDAQMLTSYFYDGLLRRRDKAADIITDYRRVARKVAAHEGEHAQVYLEDPGVIVSYGVRFREDRDTKLLGVQPFIATVGEVPVRAKRRSTFAAKELSKEDEGIFGRVVGRKTESAE